MTYGSDHAAASDALAWLLSRRADEDPADDVAIEACRAAILTAARERCEQAIRRGSFHGPLYLSRSTSPEVSLLVTRGPVMLVRLLETYELPRNAPVALTDALTWKQPGPALQAWQTAARASFLATQSMVADTGSVSSPSSAWAAVADSADLVAAICLLDRKGPGAGANASWLLTEELLLVARHVGVVAADSGSDGRSTPWIGRTVRRQQSSCPLAISPAA